MKTIAEETKILNFQGSDTNIHFLTDVDEGHYRNKEDSSGDNFQCSVTNIHFLTDVHEGHCISKEDSSVESFRCSVTNILFLTEIRDEMKEKAEGEVSELGKAEGNAKQNFNMFKPGMSM